MIGAVLIIIILVKCNFMVFEKNTHETFFLLRERAKIEYNCVEKDFVKTYFI